MAAVGSFAEIQRDFFGIVSEVVYATMTTVDSRGRPRARVLLPVWQLAGDRPVGWLATYRTPVKATHLARNPHAAFSYWSRAQHTAAADTVARWVTDEAVKREIWDLYREGSPPGVGYDPAAYWPGGPADPEFHLLRLDPWRIHVRRARELATGSPGRLWKSHDATAPPHGPELKSAG